MSVQDSHTEVVDETQTAPEREVMEFDLLIIGAGPAGLAAACRMAQLSQDAELDLSICVIEKGSEVGAHILSGTVFETQVLAELFPDWQQRGAPLQTPVIEDQVYLLRDAEKALQVPEALVPKSMLNHGNHIISLGNLCRWLAEQAEQLGVEIFPGFAAAEVLYQQDGAVAGVITGDMGVGADGRQKDCYMAGMELRARHTLFAEGCRGHLCKELIQRFELDRDSTPQHYAIGLKELWQVPDEQHQPGLVVHSTGWPLDKDTTGGSFLYHLEDNQVVVGLIIDLNYSNPWLSPFDEFQQLKQHPVFAQHLQGGKRISYGARAIAKGGLYALPEMYFPGGMLIGCDAGTLNPAKIKGSHSAIRSGILAAEQIIAERLTEKERVSSEEQVSKLDFAERKQQWQQRFQASALYQELEQSRNFAPALHKFGTVLGGAFNWLDQNLFAGRLPLTLKEHQPDYASMKPADQCTPYLYPKPDGVLSFDKPSSVFLSNTNHEEDQPCHLQLKDSELPLGESLTRYAEPAQRYCPAGVYEVLEQEGQPVFQINSQNCLHCKTCDIKDPWQNIRWMVPEGTGGPNYPNM